VSSPTPPPRLPRNYAGWLVLAFVFLYLIPRTIYSSYSNTNEASTDPAVQAKNLEAAVGAESAKDGQLSDLRKIVHAMAPARTKDESAAAVYVVARAELAENILPEDSAVLRESKVPSRQALARLYATQDKADIRTLANALPTDKFLYKLAKAQAFEKLGDKSLRYKLSPGLKPLTASSMQVTLYGFLALALLAGIALIATYCLMLATGTLKWMGHPLEPLSLVDTDRLALRAGQYFLVYIGMSILASTAMYMIPGEKTDGRLLVNDVVASAVILLSVLPLFKVPVMGRTLSAAAFGISRKAILPSLAWAIGGLFAVAPIVAVGLWIGSLVQGVAPRPDHPLYHLLGGENRSLAVLGALFMASVQAPIFEELLFRGTLLPALSGLFPRVKYHAVLGIAISSLLFASIHPQGFVMWLPLAGVGTVCCVLCYQTRSVLPGIFLHAMYNGSLVVLYLVAR
jgi:membrane protease YdiL (CAAX protease family)